MHRHMRDMLVVAGLLLGLAALTVISGHQPADRTAHAVRGPEARPSEWFWRQRAFPHGKIDPAGHRLALQQAAVKQADATRDRLAGRKSAGRSITWQQRGPTNIGGRVTDLAVHPTDADICYAAMASGGVFVTTDAGASWSPIFDHADVITVGDIALDPQDPQTIYVGTGEANAASLSFFGNGLYRSADGGITWQHLGLADTRYIARVVVDPTDRQRLFVAATGQLFGADSHRGVYRSQDGGLTWDRAFALTDSTACIDLVMHPTDPDILYAAMWERVRGLTYRRGGGPSSGVWRTTDGGDTWQPITSGLPAGSVGRIGLTIAASNPNVLYASYANSGSGFLGIYKARHGGDLWSATSSTNLTWMYGGQYPFGWFFGQIRVDPTDPNHAYALGIQLYRTINGGDNWYEVGADMHVDHHALAFCPSRPDRIYAGNDGGVYRSDDRGVTWLALPDQPTNQFYAVAIDYQLPERLYGGTQDNGTLRTRDGAADTWDRILGGDGFTTIVDPTDSQRIYAESQWGYFQRSLNGGDGFSWAMNGIDEGDRFNWHTPVVMDPTQPAVLYLASQRVYRSENGATSWQAISGDLTDGNQGGGYGTVTTLAVAPSSPAVVYAGTDDGHVWMRRPDDGQWHDISVGLPRRWVTRVAVDPTDHAIVYATFSGLRWNEPIGHVYRSTDSGASWLAISDDLPEAPVNDLVVDPDTPAVLYVGTDVGVYISVDNGERWHVLGDGLPRAPVLDLAFHQPTRTLVAGTHGRSIFAATIPPITTTPGDALPLPRQLTVQAEPNPFNPRTTIVCDVPHGGPVVLEIFDIRGQRLARPVRVDLAAGRHEFAWDGRDERGRDLPSGVYLARLTAPGAVGTAKLTLAR